MTDLQFTGDLGLFQGLFFAFIVASAAWLLYFRQIKNRAAQARYLLPTLRAAAIFLLIMMLTQPVMHHEKMIGEMGRLFLIVDNSGSMSVTDTDTPLYRKIMIAKTLGENIDDTHSENLKALIDFVNLQADAHGLLNRKSTFEDLENSYNTYSVSLEKVLLIIPKYKAEKETRELKNTLKKQITQCRQAKDENQLKSTFQGLVLSCDKFIEILKLKIDQHLKASIPLATQELISNKFNQSSRWSRIEKVLFEGDKPLLDELAANHDIELMKLNGDKLENIWSSSSNQDKSLSQISGLHSLPKAPLTALSEALLLQPGAQETAVVLFSDGQHNFGSSPIQQSKVLGNRGIKVHTVGYGSNQKPQDLAIQEINVPQNIYFQNDLTGSILFDDSMIPGQKFFVRLLHEGKNVWEKTLETDGSGLRKLDFSLPIKDLIGHFSKDSNTKSVPLHLNAAISSILADKQQKNNHKEFTVTAATQKRRLLLIDQRPRWEWRYLKSMFERHDKWEVNAVLPDEESLDISFKRGREQGELPIDRHEFFNYDMIIFGDINAKLLSDDEMTAIKDFVEQRAGGIVFIDGRRQHLQTYKNTPLKDLIPVKFLSNNPIRDCRELKLTPVGQQINALDLSEKDISNEEAWRHLAKLTWLAHVEALPGTEILVEDSHDKPRPVLVGRHFGSGKILYTASGDFWRWRYKKGDTYHNRFWQQVAGSIMERAFAVQGKHLAIDAGKSVYEVGEKGDIRVRIRDKDGNNISTADATAVIYKDEAVWAKLPLSSDAAGLYTARTEKLLAGDYTIKVRVKGLDTHAVQAEANFKVKKPMSAEFKELTVNEKLLKDIAQNSNGRYFREENVRQLSHELKSLSSGNLIKSDTALWQSYWYFALVLALFTLEWIYRKRLGLL